jgi:hypothetical protein
MRGLRAYTHKTPAGDPRARPRSDLPQAIRLEGDPDNMIAAGVGCFPADELVEIAALAVGGFILKEQRQACLVKFLEEFIPRDFDKILISSIRGVWEFDAQDARITSRVGGAYASRTSTTRFRPRQDLVMVRRDLCHAATRCFGFSPALVSAPSLSVTAAPAGGFKRAQPKLCAKQIPLSQSGRLIGTTRGTFY